VDIRVISATNQVLDSLMERGHFRSDLYFRLNGIRLHLPPLRERGEDLKRLLTRFLEVYSAKYKRSGLSLTPRALACVQAYPYPGNIRQLENFVEQMVVFADEQGVIDINALPEDLLQHLGNISEADVPAPLPQGEGGSLAKTERMLIEAALRRARHIGEAARELGIGRTTLWRKMREFNLQFTPSRRE